MVFSALLVSVLLIGAFSYQGHVSTTSNSTNRSSAAQLISNDSSTTEYSYSDNVSPVYAQLGYPTLSYNGNSPYDPHDSNFTVDYRVPHFGLDFGSVLDVPVTNLTSAVHLAETSPRLDSSNYTLVTAEFDPGVLVNGSLWAPAAWSLWFAQTYDGFWLYGQGGADSTSAYVEIDAASGAVVKAQDYATWQPILGANYTLGLTSQEAIHALRGMGPFHNESPSQTFSSALTQEGSITSISPRIMAFSSTAGIPLQDPIDSSLNGQSRLCWLISLSYSKSDYGGGAQGTFAVDAESGAVDSGWEQGTFPESGFGGVSSSMIVSSVKNITISQQTFQMNVSAAGLPNSVPVAVPGILVLKPGSDASFQVNFSSTISNYVNASLQFSNPSLALQDLPPTGLPPGVSAAFSNSTLDLPGYTSATRTVFFRVDSSAPPGTFVISLGAISPESGGIVDSVIFFLTVWNGTGQWPSPPSPIGSLHTQTIQTSFPTVSVSQTSTVTVTVNRSSP